MSSAARAVRYQRTLRPVRRSERGEPKEGEVTEGNLGFPLFVSGQRPAVAATTAKQPMLLEQRRGAAGPTRTDDLTLTKRLLYQLSYSGNSKEREF